MELHPKRKLLFLILAVCIACSVVFTETLIAAGQNHDCTGEGCPVCLQIEAAGCFLKTLKLAGIGLFLAVCSLFSVQFHKKYACFSSYFLSPITLKVRFNS
jgi:hypothetical protein